MAKEGFREQMMMDELDLNARLQFSWVDGERKGVLVGGIAWTKRWRLEKIVFMGTGMLWVVQVPGCRMERWTTAWERSEDQGVNRLVYC